LKFSLKLFETFDLNPLFLNQNSERNLKFSSMAQIKLNHSPCAAQPLLAFPFLFLPALLASQPPGRSA
jgi:hypothetical protein